MRTDDVATRGYADTPLGQLHYVAHGTGRPVLLLHQTPRSWDEFREVQPLLATSAHTVAMDMIGFGLSPIGPPPQTIEGMARGAFALLDALGIETAVVLGHHTGGAVAIEMAAASPARIDGLVLSSAPLTDPAYRSSHANGVGVDQAETEDDGSHLGTLWHQRRPYYPAARPDLLNRFIRDALAPGVDPAEGHLACARYVMEDRLPLVTAPVHLIGATADPFALPDVERIRARLAAASRVETTLIEGGTVALMEQKPAEVADVVRQLLASLPELSRST
jgi:pimeloyl-ACP methyl ester carboxylesterase